MPVTITAANQAEGDEPNATWPQAVRTDLLALATQGNASAADKLGAAEYIAAMAYISCTLTHDPAVIWNYPAGLQMDVYFTTAAKIEGDAVISAHPAADVGFYDGVVIERTGWYIVSAHLGLIAAPGAGLNITSMKAGISVNGTEVWHTYLADLAHNPPAINFQHLVYLAGDDIVRATLLFTDPTYSEHRLNGEPLGSFLRVVRIPNG